MGGGKGGQGAGRPPRRAAAHGGPSPNAHPLPNAQGGDAALEPGDERLVAPDRLVAVAELLAGRREQPPPLLQQPLRLRQRVAQLADAAVPPLDRVAQLAAQRGERLLAPLLVAPVPRQRVAQLPRKLRGARPIAGRRAPPARGARDGVGGGGGHAGGRIAV
eukprot:gene4556-biopygen155